MTVSVTTDLTVHHAMDATANTASIGGINAPTVTDTVNKVQGTAGLAGRSNATGVGGIGGNFTNTSIKSKHVAVWVQTNDAADTKANGGWRIRIAANGAQTTNFLEWTVGGADTQMALYGNYLFWCVDPERGRDFQTGTPAALTGIGMIAAIINQLTASSRETHYVDAVASWSQITVAGGTAGAKGKASEIASDDKTNGRGLFKSGQGAYYIATKMIFGSTSAASEYQDNNEVFLFEDMPVSATHYTLQFQGWSGGANNAKFGTKTGTGVAAEGSQGNTFKALGPSPFHVFAQDANINVGFYGCAFINAAAPMADALRAFGTITAADSATDDTRDANNSVANDTALMPATEAVGDGCVFGVDHPFDSLRLNIGTAGVGGTITWQYWNGSSWANLTDVTDGTNGFTTSGTNDVTFAVPHDWATRNLSPFPNGLYYVKARVASTYSTNPNATQAWVLMVGHMMLTASSVEVIRNTMVNCGPIMVRNGAILRKCSIVGSLGTAKQGAVDLGSSDPATDTVRDLTISGTATGILLKGTSTGATTYNLRNIQFSGNTNDIRVDFPAAATITINVLEGGSDPTIQNVNGCTINKVVAPVTVKVTAVLEDGTPVQNARVKLRASNGTGPFPFEVTVTITRSGSVATVTHTAHGLATGDYVEIFGANEVGYDGARQITVTGANTYTYTVTGTPATPATGTIKATFLALYGLTDVNGEISTSRVYSSNQPVAGEARKSSGSPFLKPGLVNGTVSSTAGLNATAVMVSDE